MKIETVQQSSLNCFKGLIKGSKTIPANIMNNPTKKMLDENADRWQKQIKDLGLVVIKEIKMSIQTKQEIPVKFDRLKKDL